MASCPFCRAPIDEKLAQFGGHCPKCFIEIPGEETPTDPGAKAQAEAVAQSSKTRMILGTVVVVGGVIALTSGIVGYNVWRNRVEAEASADADVLFYMEPVATTPGSSAAAPVEANPGSTAKRVRTPVVVAAANGNAGDGTKHVMDFRGDPGAADPGASNFTEEVATLKPNIELSPGTAVTIRNRSVDSLVLTDPAAIKREVGSALKRYGQQVTTCYNQRLKDAPTLRGTWEVHFTIQTTGSTANVQVVPKQGTDSTLETCISQRASTWVFPAIASPQTIEVPYKLGTAS